MNLYQLQINVRTRFTAPRAHAPALRVWGVAPAFAHDERFDGDVIH